MRNVKRPLAFWAMGLTLLTPAFAQGVFTTSPLSPSVIYTPSGEKDTARSFPITYLDKPGLTTRPANATATGRVADPIPDSLAFLRYVDSLASLRVGAIRANETATTPAKSERERTLNRLRDVPSILPFFISSASASKLTGRIKTRLSSGFGMRQHPVLGSLVSHTGIDLPAPLGTPVYATADGYCRQLINQPDGIGLAIYLSHGRGHQTLYGHLLTVGVKPGQFVTRGQVIGTVGISGRTTGPHLHYGVRYNGQPVDPLPYCFLLSQRVNSAPALTRK